MSESNELDRLRADLEVIDRYNTYSIIENARCDIIAKLEKLEAEADPWADAKAFLATMEAKTATCWQRDLAHYVRHLEADNAKQAARIAELESRPIPPLNPKQVIATACKIIARGDQYMAGYLMQAYGAGNANIYPLAGDDE